MNKLQHPRFLDHVRPGRTQTGRRIKTLCGLALMLAAAGVFPAAGDEPVAPPAAIAVQTPLVLRSSRFVLHTDLPRPEAEQTLANMEAALKNAAEYWKTPPRSQIACYVMKNQAAWADSALPHKLARVWVGGVGGATISEFVTVRGKRRVKATVYAAATPGIVEHEVIHAYCYQTFGGAGPDWYKEGMAQLVSQPTDQGGGVGCPRALADALHAETPKRIREIVRAGHFSNEMHASFGAMLGDRQSADQHVPLSDWKEQDADTVRRLEKHYRWSWSLCHMLLHNSNYNTRFRVLGSHYLIDGEASFDDAFAGMSNEVAFEYQMFLEHMTPGYRVDLCRWDWNARFRTLDQQRTISRQIEAARGFQSSGLQVSAGHRYDFTTQGQWAVSATSPMLDANGGTDGVGRMIGRVLTNFKLSEPFSLGAKGTFVVPASGNLFVRCHDSWGQLSDNRGEILLRFTRPSGNRG